MLIWQVFQPDDGIPWSGSFEDVQFTNTCPLDTAFQMVYMMWLNQDIVISVKKDEGVFLKKCIELIHGKKYNEARFIWIKKYLGSLFDSEGKTLNLMESLQEIFTHLDKGYLSEINFHSQSKHLK